MTKRTLTYEKDYSQMVVPDIATEYADLILEDRTLHVSLEQAMFIVDRFAMLELSTSTLTFVKMIASGGKKGLSILEHAESLEESIDLLRGLIKSRNEDVLSRDKMSIIKRLSQIEGHFTLLDPDKVSNQISDLMEYTSEVIDANKKARKAKDFTWPKDIEKKIVKLKQMIESLKGSVRLITKKQLNAMNILNGTIENKVDYVQCDDTIQQSEIFLEDSIKWVRSMGEEVTIPKQLHMLYTLSSKLAASYATVVAATVKMQEALTVRIGKHLNNTSDET